jgi:hypothetical protein
MSMWYDAASVSILKCTVSPRLTLMSVAKPWIVASPASAVGMSHPARGVPGSAFSTWIAFCASAAGAASIQSASAHAAFGPRVRAPRPGCESCMCNLPDFPERMYEAGRVSPALQRVSGATSADG